MKKPALLSSLIKALYAVLIVALFNGCTKEKTDLFFSDSVLTTPSFFDGSTKGPAIVQRIANRLQQSDKIQPFTKTFMHYQGLPLWQQAEVMAPTAALRTNLDNIDTIVKIPLQLTGYHAVHGYLFCRVSTDSTSVTVVDGRMQRLGELAEPIAAELMYWNNKVFGHSSFAITDTRLFAPSVQDGVVKVANVATNNTTRMLCAYGSSTVFVITSSYHCTNSGPCLSGVCDGCDACVTIDTEAYTYCNTAPQQVSWTLSNYADPENGGGGPVPPDFIPHIEPCNELPTTSPVTTICNLGWIPLDTGLNIVNSPDENLNGLSQICKSSFKFKKYLEPGGGGGGWQVAGTKDIHITIIDLVTRRAVRVTLPTMYFGLPVLRVNGEFYSADKAAEIAADAVGKASREVVDNYKLSGGTLNVVGMTLHLRQAINEKMQEHAGSVTLTPGYGITVTDYGTATYPWPIIGC